MTNHARSARLDISIAGKNVSTSLEPYMIDFKVTDKTNEEIDDLSITMDDREGLFAGDWQPERGDSITCAIICENWEKPGDKIRVEFGKFEIDEVETKAPPSVVEIKAVSAINSAIRRQLVNKAWEKITFEKMVSEIAAKHKLDYLFDAEDFEIDRLDQNDQSDLSLLAKVCDDNGLKVKIVDDTLIIFSEEDYEAKDVAFQLSKHELSEYSFKCQSHDVYKECKVQYYDPKTKKAKKSTVGYQYNSDLNKQKKAPYVANADLNKPRASSGAKKAKKPHYGSYTFLDQANAKGGGKTLVIRQKVHSEKEAEKLAKARLREKNKGEWTANLSTMGNKHYVAGVVFELLDCGRHGGCYLVDTATHSLSRSSGYTVDIEAHRVLGEGGRPTADE